MIGQYVTWVGEVAHSALDAISNELVDVRIFPLFLLSSLYFIFSLLLNCFISMFDFLITSKCCGVEGDYGTCCDYLFKL